MNFLRRAFAGLGMTILTLGLLATAGWHLYSTVTNVETRQRPPARERSFVVDTGTLTSQTVSPVLEAFGQVQAWNSLEIRAPAAGPITEISANFREGLSVNAGELLFRIDPELASRRVVDAKAALNQAHAELQEATQNKRHLEAEAAAARAESAVRRADLERKQSLFEKKLVTSTTLDDATLAFSASEQSVVAKERESLALAGRIDKAQAGVERAQLTLSDAERALGDTSYRAPFAGRLTEVALTLGRRVSENEKLGLLIDPAALEVAFPVRNSDFGRLLDPANKQNLAPLSAEVTLDLSGTSLKATAVLERPAAVASTQTGRTVFARITGGEVTALRPNDFVSIGVTEPALHDVAVIPAEAATLDGRILLVGTDNRLSDHQARIVGRQSDSLIVADVPFGASYVRRRLPYLSGGIKVQARDVERPATSGLPVALNEGRGSRTGRAENTEPQKPAATLDQKRRAELIAHVKNRPDMPEERRQRLLEELEKPDPERRIVERIERSMARTEKRS